MSDNAAVSTTHAGQSNPHNNSVIASDPRLYVSLAALLALPIATLIAIPTFLAFQIGRVHYRTLALLSLLVTVAVCAVTAALGWPMGRTYLQPYQLAITSIGSKHAVDWAQVWPSLVVGMLPLSLIAGMWLGTIAAAWRWRRRPKWIQQTLRATPREVLRRRRTHTAILNDQKPPHDGFTLGVGPDGRRIIQTDDEAARHSVLVGGVGSGKALDVDTPIPTPDRGMVRMGDLQAGDWVFGSGGTPVRVIGAYDPMVDHDCYEVAFSDGSTIVADAEHLWTVHTTPSHQNVHRQHSVSRHQTVGSAAERKVTLEALQRAGGGNAISTETGTGPLNRDQGHGPAHDVTQPLQPRGTLTSRAYPVGYGDKQPVTLTTAHIAETCIPSRPEPQYRRYSIPVAPAAQYPTSVNQPLDPYALGLYLGHGGTNDPTFTTTDEELIHAWNRVGYTPKKVPSSPHDYRIVGLLPTLRALDIIDNKHIPPAYLVADEGQRRALLAGLLDSDGTHEGGARVSFTTTVERLVDDVVTLAASLGYQPTKHRRYSSLNGRRCGPDYVASFPAHDDVFRLARKADPHQDARGSGNTTSSNHRYIVDVRPVASRPVRCIAVAADDHLYLAGRNYIATHNTTAAMLSYRDAIRRGHGVIVIDAKGGRDVPEVLAAFAQEYGRGFDHFSFQDPMGVTPYDGPSVHGPAFYDPLADNDFVEATRRANFLIDSQKWSDNAEVYRSSALSYALQMFLVDGLFHSGDTTPTLDRVQRLLQPDRLRSYAERPSDVWNSVERGAEYRESVLSMTQNLGAVDQSAIRDLTNRVHQLRSGVAGHWLRPQPGGRVITLQDSAARGDIVVFSLDSSAYPVLTELVGSFIIQDLMSLSSERRNRPDPRHPTCQVFIDEFTALNNDAAIIALLSKCRDARMPVRIATQTLSDMARVDEHFLGQLMGLVNCFQVMGTNLETDAVIFAGLTGKVEKARVRQNIEMTQGAFRGIGTGSGTGSGSVEYVEDYAVSPAEIQRLTSGQMVYVAKTPDQRVIYPVNVVRLTPDPVSQRYEPPLLRADRYSSAAPPDDTGHGDQLPSPSPRPTWTDTPPVVHSSASPVPDPQPTITAPPTQPATETQPPVGAPPVPRPSFAPLTMSQEAAALLAPPPSMPPPAPNSTEPVAGKPNASHRPTPPPAPPTGLPPNRSGLPTRTPASRPLPTRRPPAPPQNR